MITEIKDLLQEAVESRCPGITIVRSGAAESRAVMGRRFPPVSRFYDEADRFFSRIIPAIPRKWTHDGFDGLVVIHADTGVLGADATGRFAAVGAAARYGRGLLTFTDPSAVEAALGDGPLRDLLVSALWIAKTTAYAPALEGTIAGVLSAVTPGAENGGTGAVSVSGDPCNEYTIVVEILSSGRLNEAVFRVTIDGLPGKRLTMPDAPENYPIPEMGITLTFDTGAEGFAVGDTFVFTSAEPSAANTEVIE